MFMDGIGMLLFTLPVVFLVMTKLGSDPIWFGIICPASGALIQI